MPNNIVPVSFMNPADQVAAAAAQQDMQRRQALADELRRQSLQDIPGNGGRVSWTQGVARLAQALAAKRMNRENQAQSWDLLARQTNAQAAMHDPSGTAIPQIDPSTNPYTAGEQGRNLGQRIGDFVRGGPPVDGKAMAAALRARLRGDPGMGGATPPDTDPTGPDEAPSAVDRIVAALRAKQGFADRAASDGDPLPTPPPTDPKALAAAIRAAAKGTIRLTPTGPTTALPNSDAASGGMPPNPTMSAGGPAAAPPPPAPLTDGRALAARVRAAAGLPAAPRTAPAPPGGTLSSRPPASLSAPATVGSDPGPYAGYAAGSAAAPASPPTTAPTDTAPSMATQQPDGAVMDALIPTMTARAGYVLGQAAPEEYWKAVAAAGTPIDDVKRVVQMGLDPHSGEGLRLLRSSAAKNMQTPLGDDRRGYIYDPYTGKSAGFHPQISNDSMPVYDASGNVVGEKPIQGAAQTIETIDAAKARGAAAGQTEKVWDAASGTYKLKSRADVLSGVGAPAGGYQADPRPGLGEGLKDRGIESSKGYTAISNGAADVNTRIDTLRQAAQLARNGTPFGPGSQSARTVAGFMNSIANSVGWGNLSWNDKRIATVDEFNKLMNRYAMQQAKLSGTDGTDAARALTIAGNPNDHMTPSALAKIFPNVLGFEYENKARAAQATAYANRWGVDTLPQFNGQWTKNSDPRIYRWIVEDELNPPRPGQPGATARNMAALKKSNPRDYAELVRKAKALGSIGALP